MPTDLAIAFTTLFSVIFFCSFTFFSPFLSPRRISFCGKGKGRSYGWGGGTSIVRSGIFSEWNNKKCCLVTAVMYYYVHNFFNMDFSSSPPYLSLFICLSVANLHCLINEGDTDDVWWCGLIFPHRNLQRVSATRCLSIHWTFSLVAKPSLTPLLFSTRNGQ